MLCAVSYSGSGGDYAVNSCNGNCKLLSFPRYLRTLKIYVYVLIHCTAFLGDITYHFDGAADDAGPHSFFPMGSILVKLGCTIYMFAGNNFKADG